MNSRAPSYTVVRRLDVSAVVGALSGSRPFVDGLSQKARIETFQYEKRSLIHASGRFKLDKETLAIGDADGKPVAVTIPAGDTVMLIAEPSPGKKMVDVLWRAARWPCTLSI